MTTRRIDPIRKSDGPVLPHGPDRAEVTDMPAGLLRVCRRHIDLRRTASALCPRAR